MCKNHEENREHTLSSFIQRLSVEEIRAMQLQRLRATDMADKVCENLLRQLEECLNEPVIVRQKTDKELQEINELERLFDK